MTSASATRRLQRIFQEWPPQAFFRMRQPAFATPQLLDVGQDVADRMVQIADRLREFAPRLLASCLDADQQGAEEFQLVSDVQFLESVAASVSSNPHGSDLGRMRPAESLIECLRGAHLLSNRGEFINVVRHGIRLVLPPALARALETRMQQGHLVLKKSAIIRGRFGFDCAFALLCRTELPAGGTWYAWADSSPQGGRDWLLGHSHHLLASTAPELLKLADAVNELAAMGLVPFESLRSEPYPSSSEGSDADSTACLLQEDVGDSGGVEPQSRASKCRSLTRQVVASWSYHCMAPGALGSKAGSLEHKCSTLLHSLSLESQSTAETVQRLDALISMTTDMGVEMGLTNVALGEAGFCQCFNSSLKRTFGARHRW